MVRIPNEDINRLNEAKFKEAWLQYLADDNTNNWYQWDKLRQVMFAMGKEPDEVEALMNEAEASRDITKGKKKDGNFKDREESYFDKVVDYCSSEEKARKFSMAWREV